LFISRCYYNFKSNVCNHRGISRIELRTSSILGQTTMKNPGPGKMHFLSFKYITMGNSTHQEQHGINEGLRNALIVILVFGLIAAISYVEWADKLH
jgi:hypothetical protein